MDRWIVVSLSVVFACFATGCDSNSSTATESTSTERQQARSSSDEEGTYRTRTGLTFEAPTDWTAKLMPAGAQLIPPDGPDTEDSYLLVIRFAPDDTDDATDASYVDDLAEDFTDRISEARIATRETGLENPMGPASYVAWNIEKPDRTKRVGFYVVISDPWMLVLRATGPRSSVDQRRETLESIFATANLTDAEVHPNLVGTWRRAAPRRTEKGTFDQTLELRDDGTLRLTHEPTATEASTKKRRDLGRWAATGDKFFEYVGNSLHGGVQLQTHQWRLDDQGWLHLGTEGESTTWKPVDS